MVRERLDGHCVFVYLSLPPLWEVHNTIDWITCTWSLDANMDATWLSQDNYVYINTKLITCSRQDAGKACIHECSKYDIFCGAHCFAQLN
jgi:hypothetical protein